jgi:inositol oxygenase
VVGDTFPVGCRHSQRIVYPEFFAANPDSQDSRYSSELGIYSTNCGLDKVHMSWGHDEYLYHLLKDYLPEPAQYMIRYHSFYAWHKEGQYRHLTDARDDENLRWVQKFNPYDLYSKNPNPPLLAELKPYYEDLLAKYLPATLKL